MNIPTIKQSPRITAARSSWQYRGDTRPSFAERPTPMQNSVWDFPRPPLLEKVEKTMTVHFGNQLIAKTSNGLRVLETASAPTYYFPPEDILIPLTAQGARSICEWKGLAESISIEDQVNIGWRYIEMFPEFSKIYKWVAFYPNKSECFLGSERVTSQPGGYYGGWVSQDLSGPIKGAPGTSGW